MSWLGGWFKKKNVNKRESLNAGEIVQRFVDDKNVDELCVALFENEEAHQQILLLLREIRKSTSDERNFAKIEKL